MRITVCSTASARLSRLKGLFCCSTISVPPEANVLRSFSRLYRGISAPILMEAPKRATKFAANDEWGKFYRNMFGVSKMNQSLSVLTGATAGATESFVVVPFELVKIRLQDKASAGKYNGMIDCVVKTVRNEGILAMYQGLESTMWRHILWNAGYFGCIFQVRQMLPKADTKQGQITNDIISGTVGGTVGTMLNTPMDVVKSRIQNTPRVPGQVPKYNWAWSSVFTVLREEGAGALYKGFLPKVLRLGYVRPDCAINSMLTCSQTRWWYPPRGVHQRHRDVPQLAEIELAIIKADVVQERHAALCVLGCGMPYLYPMAAACSIDDSIGENRLVCTSNICSLLFQFIFCEYW